MQKDSERRKQPAHAEPAAVSCWRTAGLCNGERRDRGDREVPLKIGVDGHDAKRADRLGDGLYSAAVAWKFRPQAEPVANWERAREAWLEAYDEVSALSDASRSLFSALRWVARRRTVGELSTFALPPEVRVLRRIAAEIRAKGAVTPDLRRDWQVFN